MRQKSRKLKQIKEKMKSKIDKRFDPITEPEKLRTRALYWLGQKEFSVSDFRNKLQRVCADLDMIEQLLQDFIARDWLNEQRYMTSFVRQKISAGLGQYRIKQELNQHGIKSSESELYFEQMEFDWFEQALATYQKKYGQSQCDDFKEKGKRFRYMQYRGFSPDQIKYAMEAQAQD